MITIIINIITYQYNGQIIIVWLSVELLIGVFVASNVDLNHDEKR